MYATVSGADKRELDVHLVFVCSLLPVNQRNLNEKMKIEKEKKTKLTGYLSVPVLLFFPVSKEDVLILM